MPIHIPVYFQGQLHYNINVPGLTWSMLFREIESHREDLSIVDYSVTQATLEEVGYVALVLVVTDSE